MTNKPQESKEEVPSNSIENGDYIIEEQIDQTNKGVNYTMEMRPTAKEFIERLKKSNPEALKKLQKNYEKYGKIPKEKESFEESIDSKIKPLYFSKALGNKRGHSNIAVLPNGKITNYNLMGTTKGAENLKDLKFIGYGIYVSKDF